MSKISSRTNPRIKIIRSLRSRRARAETGLFLVEGIRHVGEAVEAGADIVEIYYAPEFLHSSYGLDLIEQQTREGTECVRVSGEVFSSLTDKENPQGILAVIRQVDLELTGLSGENFPWGVAIVAPQDPGNLGAVMRTVDAVGASGLLLLDGGVDQYHPTTVRASMGTLFWQRVVSTSFSDFSSWATRSGYHIYGSSAHAEMDYRQLQVYRSPRILLLGSEREGLTPNQAAVCERLVRLPMQGRATSLNLAVAAGVLLFAILEADLDATSAPSG